MHRTKRLALGAAATIVVAAVTSLIFIPFATADSNALSNGGFETGSLSPWSCAGGLGSVVSSPVHGGTKALAGAASSSDNAQCTQTLTVQANTAYTLSGFVNGSYVYLGVTGSATASNWTPGTGGAYSKLSVSFTTGSSTSLTVYVHGWYGQGTYYADDISLIGPGGNPSPSATSASPSPSPSVSPSASPSPSVSPSVSPSASPSPTPSTSPPNTGPLPKHFLTGYWQNFTNGARALRLADVPTSYDLIAVAFGVANPNQTGGVTFGVDSGLSSALGGYTDANLKADVATVHSRGQHVVLSIGGETGNVSVGDATAATNFANSAYSIISSYGFDGIDIDLENGLNATYMEQALRQLRTKVGSNLIITMAPQTIDMQSTGNAYFKLALAIKDILTVVHTQFYNSGSMLGCDQQFAYSQGTENFLTALACIQLQSALRPDQVALGLPATSSAAGGGYTAPSVINAALDCLAKGTSCSTFKPPSTWPSIRGAMTWSINWDASNSYNFANTIAPHLDTLP